MVSVKTDIFQLLYIPSFEIFTKVMSKEAVKSDYLSKYQTVQGYLNCFGLSHKAKPTWSDSIWQNQDRKATDIYGTACFDF